MPVSRLFEPLPFARGPVTANRLALSPMTSDQALPDGRITADEVRWIRMRAEGGFGMVLTSASYVQPSGKGGPGQTGICDDRHTQGLTELAQEIRGHGRVAALQLHHAGHRAWRRTVAEPVAPSDHAESGARAMTTAEVEGLVEDFVAGARRAERAGFHGVEVHGAHGYLLAQFLSPEDNRRSDRYGGSLENRARVLFEITRGVRRACRPDFQLGLRLSPERWGMRLAEVRDVARDLMAAGDLDWLDLSLWDALKAPVEPGFQDRRLFEWFTDLPRRATRLGVSGKIATPAIAAELLDAGADLVFVGRAAILHHDWPRRAAADPSFVPVATPVLEAHLAAEGVGERFIRYLHTFDGFVRRKELAS